MPWLERTDDPHEAKCSVCVKYLSTNKTVLANHAKSVNHTKNIQRKAGTQCYADYDISSAGPSSAGMISTDSESASSSEQNFAVPAKQKVIRQRTFCADWVEDPDFKPWLVPIPDNPTKGRCIICCRTIVANKTALQHHGKSSKHAMNTKHREDVIKHMNIKNFQELLKLAEMRICMDAVEHKRPFESYCHIINLLQAALPVPDMLSHMTLSSKKMGAIVKKVINKTISEESTETLERNFFSVLIDETTDISNTKILCFLIRYAEQGQIKNYLLDLIGISDGTADNMYNCFLHSLKKNNLSLTSVVGVCVDNANVMVGARNSLTSRLLTDNPSMYMLPCICHSLHLVASHAYKCLPSFIDDFLHLISSYFSRSPKRLGHLQEVQEFMKVEQVKVLQPSATRWLALADCIQRVLNQWLPLFSSMATTALGEETDDFAAKIFKLMNDRFTKVYLEFLSYSLNGLINVNKFFQNSNVKIHRVHSECYKLLRLFASNFVKPEYVGRSDLHKLDVDEEENLLALETIHPGTKCINLLREIENSNGEGDRENITEFYRNVKKFYQTAFQNIVKRIPFDDMFLKSLDFLDPVIALDISRHRTSHLASVLEKFKSKNLHKETLLDEWRLMGIFWGEAEKTAMLALDHIDSLPENSESLYAFKNLLQLAQLCLSLPHSNADVERYFSQVTLTKSKVRNSLKTETVAALTRIQLDLNNKKANCFNYQLTDKMLNLFNSKMYDADAVPRNLKGILLPEEPDESDSASDSGASDIF